MCGRNKNAVQDKANSIRKSGQELGESRKSSKGGKCIYYSQNEAERLIKELEETSANGKDREKRERVERGEARIDQAKIPVEFTKTILLHLKNKSLVDGNGKKSLGDLNMDFQEVLMDSSSNEGAVQLLITRFTPKQLKEFIFLCFVKSLKDILTIPQQETYIESIERKNNARLIQELGGVEKIINAVKKHFSPEEKSVATFSPER